METTKWHPGTLLQVSGYYWRTCTLHAGVKLDVFTVIGDQALGAADVAAGTSSDNRAMAMLLNALTAMHLLEKDGDGYRNTPESKKFLSKASPAYLGFMIMHHHHLVESWAKLDQAVRTGRPVRQRASFADETVRESFLMGMFNQAMLIAPLIVPSLDLAGRRHLLDLGGGPGTYAIHFCQRYSALQATVADLPTTRRFAEKTIERFGLADRIRFQDLDFNSEPIPMTYDAAWLSHVLHGEGPDNCRQMIGKAFQALEPGGIILIHDFILDNTMDAPLFPALFSLNMLCGTEEGRAYSEAQIADMMTAAGFVDIERVRMDPEPPNNSGIMRGIKR